MKTALFILGWLLIGAIIPIILRKDKDLTRANALGMCVFGPIVPVMGIFILLLLKGMEFNMKETKWYGWWHKPLYKQAK